uniref:ATP synthase complex subunit 8 n=1 Tax=Monocellicampa pruni TaxID=1322158 RepID=K4LJA7_9HYME|nr:ATP synthase FO subunit 8 [Monocellicampa pruni]
MPQMFPLNWMILYIYFITILLLMIVNNFYYSNSHKSSNHTLKLNTSTMAWKW